MSGPRIGSLFSGYGGLEQGVQSVLGGTVAWHSEIDPGACKILAHRYPTVPNLGDIERIGLPFSDEEWKEIKVARKAWDIQSEIHGGPMYEMPVPDWSDVDRVDVLTGGFPCQDVSAAGKREGIRPGTRSGLWGRFLDAIEQLNPSLVVIENVRGLLSANAHHPAHSDVEPCPWELGDGSGPTLRALGAVLGDLADVGFDAEWVGLRATDVGAPHGRFRVFVAAWPAADAAGARRGEGEDRRAGGGDASPWSRSGEPQRGGGERGAVAQDADVTTGGERRLSAPGQAEGRGARADAGGRGGAPAADASQGGRGASLTGLRPGESDPGRRAPAHADRDGLDRLEELHGIPGDDADGLAVVAGGLDWGAYTAAVRRWERLTRPAPGPTERGKNGQPRLSPAFVEWLMGLPVGWVTDVPDLSRNEQLKALGNGVVPQQAAQALRMLLPDATRAAA